MAWTAQSSWEPGVTDPHQPIPPPPHTTAVSARDGRGARPHPVSQRPCHSGRTTGITQGRRSLYGGAEQKSGTDRKEENLQMLGKEAAWFKIICDHRQIFKGARNILKTEQKGKYTVFVGSG